MGPLNKDKGRTRCSQGAPNQGAGERLALRLQCNRAEHVRGGKAEAQEDSIKRSERKRAGTLSEQHKTGLLVQTAPSQGTYRAAEQEDAAQNKPFE